MGLALIEMPMGHQCIGTGGCIGFNGIGIGIGAECIRAGCIGTNGGCWLQPQGPNFPEGGAARFSMAPAGTVPARTHWTLPDNCSQGWGSSLV